MAGIPLASAFVRIRPDTDTKEFKKQGEAAGKASGQGYGEGFYRDASGKLRQANGRFATDAQKKMFESGGVSGRGFGTAFNREGGGIIRKGFGKLKNELGPLLVPLGVGAAVLAIGKIGITYENNLNIFQAVTKATGKQMDIVAKKARDLGADVQLPGVSAAGAAAAMTELSKAGFTVQQSMDAARGTLQLARIASISEADAATIAANAVNAFGIQAKDTGFVVDELAAAANSSSVEISDVSLAFKMAAAVFAGVQGPAVGSKEAITELNTAIAILGNNGIKGSDAGTSLKQMLLQLTGPTEHAKAQMKLLAERAQGANISLELQNQILHGTAKQYREGLAQLDKLNPKLKGTGDIAYDSAGNMRGLRDILALTAAGLNGMTQEEKNFAITQIFGADASRSVLALLKGAVPAYLKQRDAVLESGSAAKVAAAQNRGLGGAIDNVKSQFENMAIAIYNEVKGPLTTGLTGLANALSPVAGYISALADNIRNNIGVYRDWAIAIGAVTAALKLNSTILAIQAAGSVIKFIQGISIITKVTQGWAAAQALLNATLIANPIGAVIIALVAIGAALFLLYRHNETFRKAVQAVWSAIKTAVSATVNWIVNTAWPWLVKAWQAIADAAMWLYKNAILPAWHGIQAAIGFVVMVVQKYIQLLVFEFNIVKTVVLFLWQHVFGPAFAGISKFIQIWWLAAQIVFKAFYIAVKAILIAVIYVLKAVFTAVFDFLVKRVFTPWWSVVRFLFNAFRQYVLGPVIGAVKTMGVGLTVVFKAIASLVSWWWNNVLKPIFVNVRAGWQVLAQGFVNVWNKYIKPLFQLFITYFSKNVVGAFNTGVSAITHAWAKIKEAARTPVAFVVNKVINPFINGLNNAAKIVGVKDRVSPIGGFAEGGEVPGFATGGRITGAPSSTDNRLAPARIPGVGAVKLAGGEFVVNARDTARALPLLKWINAGMRDGAGHVKRMLGKPLSDTPGDGSEGWAFADGGLVGWTKDLWSALSNPTETIKRPFEAALSRIPGGGTIKNFLIGSAKRLLNGALGWLTGSGGGSLAGTLNSSVNAIKARTFVQQQAGKPYVWASAGPGGYDCSGIVSAAYNILKGGDPYRHTFSTQSLPGQWFDPGRKLGALIAGWSHPGQRPASASVGHMAGQIAGLPFESTGGSGVRIGNRARKVTEFANVGAARAMGGLIGDLMGQPVRLFDQGGMWPSGTLGANLSGRTEYVDPTGQGGRGGGRQYSITVNVSPGTHPAEVGRQTVLAIQAFERANGKGWRR